jgi:hypothetical protein
MGKRRKIRSVSVLPTCLSLGNVLHAFSVVKGLSRQDDQIQVANQSMTLQMFHPFDQLAVKLLAASADDEDGAHDLSHIVRVWRNAKLIQREEGGGRPAA